jgi:succinate dehydrogenase / fumarate reductase cytochrome b subunit
MKNKRPVNLALHTISFPVAALVSISHRISGIVLFIGSGLSLGILGYAMDSEEKFEQARTWLDMESAKIGLLLVLLALVFHSLAGIRHLLMDVGIGESLVGGRVSASLVFLLTAITTWPLISWLW